MILVDYPYENEPSYASLRFSDESKAYNTGIRHASILYAMCWLLDPNSPSPVPSYFKEVVDAHFVVQRERILKCLDVWEEHNKENKGRNCSYFSWTNLFPNGAWETNRAALEKAMNALCEVVNESPAAEPKATETAVNKTEVALQVPTEVAPQAPTEIAPQKVDLN